MPSLCCAVVVLLCLSEVGSQEAAGTKKRDHYSVLGVPRSASDQQVKRAFRQLAMTLHPDKNKSVDAEENFRELTAAYEVLSNRKRRERYDLLGHEAYLSEDEEDPEEDQDWSDVVYFRFEDLSQFMFQEEEEEEEEDCSLKGSEDEHRWVNMAGQSYWGDNIMVHWGEEEDDDEDGEEWGEEDDGRVWGGGCSLEEDNEKYQYWWTPPSSNDGD